MNIIIGICGGIAAYKVPMLIRQLKKNGHQVQCVATRHALQFVTPLTLETLSQRSLYCDLFENSNEVSTEHIALKDWGDMIVVAPATANIIGKMAHGIADDALSTLLLAMSAKPRYVCPAMNSDMLHANATQRNIEQLRKDNVKTEKEANETHYEVGKKVRKAIADIGRNYARRLTNSKKEPKTTRKRKQQKLK